MFKYYHHKEFIGNNEYFAHHHAHDIYLEGNSKKSVREISVQKNILDSNIKDAEVNREIFNKSKTFVLNIMSSPGSGKTTLLVKTLSYLIPQIKCAVVVGDICTTNDADRLSLSGVQSVQINTDQFGGDCHLTAKLVKNALETINLTDIDLLIIENLGNLVCPAEFDIGEDERVVILSVTEGEDKPLKYPLMFRECKAALLSKIDLLPYLDYDIKQACDNIYKINPKSNIIKVSSKTEEGLDLWIDWIKEKILLKKNRLS